MGKISVLELTSVSVGFVKILVQHVSYLGDLQDHTCRIIDPWIPCVLPQDFFASTLY